MIQPGVAQTVVGDPMMKDQGFLSRLLIVWPDSNIGSRQIINDPSRSAAETEAKAMLLKFDERFKELLKLELPIHPETRADLDPRQLKLSDQARAKLEEFYNRVEHASNKGDGRVTWPDCCTMHISSLWAERRPSLRFALRSAKRTNRPDAIAA